MQRLRAKHKTGVLKFFSWLTSNPMRIRTGIGSFFLSMLISLAIALSAALSEEYVSVVGEVVISAGSLKSDTKAKKEIEAIARKLAKLPGQKMIEIEGAYPRASGTGSTTTTSPETMEEYFSRSFFLAMEAEEYIRGTLGVQQDYYLSARSMNKQTGAKPHIRIVLHSGTFEKQPFGVAESTPVATSAPSAPSTGQQLPSRPQVTPTIGVGGSAQQSGQIPRFEPVYDTGPIDERLVAEQARRAAQLIEQTKLRAAERERRRAAEEKAAAKDLMPQENAQ
jgi:hypothetical protein